MSIKHFLTATPKARWSVFFRTASVCVCVGSAVPPGCPETNWQLEKLWLQGKVSKGRDGDKEERAGEGEKGGKRGTRHNNIHKGRAESAKCAQQSLLLCEADSPVFMPTFQKNFLYSPQRSSISKQYLRVENNSFNTRPSLPSPH